MASAACRMWDANNRAPREAIGEALVRFGADGEKRPGRRKQRNFTLQKRARTSPKCLERKLHEIGLGLAVRQFGPKYWPVKAQAVQQPPKKSVVRIIHAMVSEPVGDGGEGAAALKEVMPLELGGSPGIETNHY